MSCCARRFAGNFLGLGFDKLLLLR